MWPSARRLDGSQKYRKHRRPGKDLDPETNRWPSLGAIGIFLTILTGSANAQTDSADGDDGASSSDGDAGSDGGDGGGD
jgi:hypothetical protein